MTSDDELDRALARLEGPDPRPGLSDRIMHEVTAASLDRSPGRAGSHLLLPLLVMAVGAVLAVFASGAAGLFGLAHDGLAAPLGVALMDWHSPLAPVAVLMAASGAIWFARAGAGGVRAGGPSRAPST